MKRLLVIGAAAAAVSASAQVVLTGPGTYFQDFNTLALSGTGIAWTNNLPASGMQGWHSIQTTYDADDGTGVGSGQYSFGTSGSGERALGSQALPGAIIVYGIRLNNASGGTFGALNLDYFGEQWRSGSTLTDMLTFEYSMNATNLVTGNWSPVTSLDFNSPTNTGSGALNGNLAANRTFRSGTMSSLGWANGTDMWVRWTHVGNGSRHALGIDELHLNAVPVPEPATMTALALGGLALLRRRRKN